MSTLGITGLQLRQGDPGQPSRVISTNVTDDIMASLARTREVMTEGLDRFNRVNETISRDLTRLADSSERLNQLLTRLSDMEELRHAALLDARATATRLADERHQRTVTHLDSEINRLHGYTILGLLRRFLTWLRSLR